MSLLENISSSLFSSSLKTQTFGWGRVATTPFWCPESAFLSDFEFNENSPNCWLKKTNKDQVTRRRKLYTLWDNPISLFDLFSAQAQAQANFFKSSKMDDKGNIYTCFALLVDHRVVTPDPGNKTPKAGTFLQMYVCLARTNPQGSVHSPDNFANLTLTKTLFPAGWNDGHTLVVVGLCRVVLI